MRLVNFAHGEFYMMGGLLGWAATSLIGLDFFTGLIVVVAIMSTFGWLLDRFIIVRVRDKGPEPGILLTIGLAIFLTNTALLLVGTAPHKVAAPVSSEPLIL